MPTTFRTRPALESTPAEPLVEIELPKPGRRRGTEPAGRLALEQWGFVDPAAASLRDDLLSERSVALLGTQARPERILIPVARLNFLSEAWDRLLAPPRPSDATVKLRLRSDNRLSFGYEIIDTPRAGGAIRLMNGFYESRAGLRYLNAGLHAWLLDMTAAAAEGIEAVERVALSRLSAESWERLRQESGLLVRPVTRLALMARHDDPKPGFTFMALPVRADDPETAVVHDPYDLFMRGVDAITGDRMPVSLFHPEASLDLDEAVRDTLDVIRRFNAGPMSERNPTGLHLGIMLGPDSPRAIARAERFGERVLAYGDPLPAITFAAIAKRYGRSLLPTPPRGPLRVAPAAPVPPEVVAALGPALKGTVPDAAFVSDGTARTLLGPAAEATLPSEDGDERDGGDAFPAGAPDLGTPLSEAGLGAPGAPPSPSPDPGPDECGDRGRIITGENVHVLSLVQPERPRALRQGWAIEDLLGLLAERSGGEPLPPAMPHQLEAVHWARAIAAEGRGGGILADEPGTGKTLTALLAMAALAPDLDGGILVVVEDQMADVWFAEARRRFKASDHYTFLRAYGSDFRACGPGAQLARLRRAPFALTTWNMLPHLEFLLPQVRFGAAFFDEGGLAKNPLSDRHRIAKSIGAEVSFVLTGTPLENGIADVWALCEIPRPGRFGTLTEFMARHEVPDRAAAVEATGELLRAGPVPMMLRRTKAGLNLDLPTRTVSKPRRMMPPEQARAYDKALQGIRNRDRLHYALRQISLHPDPLSIGQDPSQRKAVRFLGQSARTQETYEMLLQAQATGEKVLIFTIDVQRAQVPLATAFGYALGLRRPLLAFNGTDLQADRDEQIARFRRAKGFEALMLTSRLGSRGLTLTEAHLVAHLERWYNPAVEDQSSDRVHRIGLDHPVGIAIPMAIHPELGEQSYDVLQDAWIEEKRLAASGFLSEPPDDVTALVERLRPAA